jgi:hypothetical protein
MKPELAVFIYQKLESEIKSLIDYCQKLLIFPILLILPIQKEHSKPI